MKGIDFVMENYKNLFLAIIMAGGLAYFLGSISFAVIVSKLLKKDDVRKYGSNNAGMTNVLRVYGKIPAVITGLGDFFKGFFAVLIGRYIFQLLGVDLVDGGYVAGLFAMLGHLYPLYFNFKGGKGVLTGLGIMLVVNPLVFLILIVLLLPTIFITKIVSLGSVIGAFLFPFVTLAIDLCFQKPLWSDFLFSSLFAALVIYKHKDNIKRLLNGTESRFGQSKKNTIENPSDQPKQ